MYWLEVSVTVDEEAAEIVSEVLRPFAQDNVVVLEQLGDARDLDPDALEPDITVKIYVPGDDDTAERRQQIIVALSRLHSPDFTPVPNFHMLEEADWANAWKENYKPFRVEGRLWIQPSWLEDREHAPDDVVLTLDPGMAFGTGTHQTTQMCLAALERLIAGGDRVLDVGTGSGILAVAAAKLGASRIVALDTDRQAVKAVLENALINQVASKISAYEGALAGVAPEKGEWDLVLVNILAPVIISLLAEDDLLEYAAENGRLILSGIVEEQVIDVDRAVLAAGGQVVERMSMDDWVALVVKRRF